MADCLTESDLERLHAGVLAEETLERLRHHLRNCPKCAQHDQRFRSEVEKLAQDLRKADFSNPTPAASPVKMHERNTSHLAASLAIEGYEIIRELGRGGMGVVYEAMQLNLNRRVALKVLPVIHGAVSGDAVLRFRREASSAAKLHHTNIVPIYDFGQTGHTYYYAMELLDGHTLSEMIRRFAAADVASASRTALAEILAQVTVATEGAEESSDDAPLTPDTTGSRTGGTRSGSEATGRARIYFRQVAQWMADVAIALHYAHSQGIIHRDIKPSNLVLAKDGRLMILDFGLAKSESDPSVTRRGSLLGTLRYMSPEQAMAKRMRVDHRTDIYSLGTTMYELLTYRPVFQGRDEKEVLGQVITKAPTPPRKIVPLVPRDLETICLKTLEKDAAARYETAADFAEDLQRYVRDEPIIAKPPGILQRFVKYVRRRPAVSVATGATVLLVVATAFAIKSSQRARERHVEALINQGIAHWQAHQWQDSEPAFETALGIDPKNVRALANFAMMKKDEYLSERDPACLDEADNLLERTLNIEPGRVELWNIKGIFLRMRGRIEDAINAHRLGNEVDSAFYPNWVSLSCAYAMNRQIEDAEQALLIAMELPGTEEEVKAWHNLLAVQLQQQKSAAVDTLSKLPDKAKTTAPTVLLKARLYLQLAGHLDFRLALRAATTADELSRPDHADPRTKRILALAELRNEHWGESIVAASAALDLDDDPAYPRLILALAEARRGNTTAARNHLAIAKSTWPAHLEAQRFRATAEGGYLWFETIEEFISLRVEVERILASD